MASGRWHDRFNIFLLLMLNTVFITNQIHYLYIIIFSSFWLFSTLMFSPDADLMPKKRAGLLRIFLYPYSMISKHRGMSHRFLLGTITRVLYCLLMIMFVIFILNRMGEISYSADSFSREILYLIENFSLEDKKSLIIIWGILGFWGADIGHIFLDKISSFLPKWPF